MKKLGLKALNLGAKEVLTRTQIKAIKGGFGTCGMIMQNCSISSDCCQGLECDPSLRVCMEKKKHCTYTCGFELNGKYTEIKSTDYGSTCSSTSDCNKTTSCHNYGDLTSVVTSCY